MKTYSDFCEESNKVGVVKYFYTNRDGVKIYSAMIEWVVYDHSPRNPSLPVTCSSHLSYDLTEEEALKHIRSAGFDGNIIYR